MPRWLQDGMKWFGTTVAAGLVVNWIATATQTWAASGFTSFATAVFTWPNMLAASTTVLTLGALAIPVGLWIRRDRLRDIAKAKTEGDAIGFARGQDEGYNQGSQSAQVAAYERGYEEGVGACKDIEYNKGFITGKSEGHKDAQPRNAWDTYARVVDALVSQHDNLNEAMSSLRSLQWKSYANGQMLNLTEPMIRIWNRLVEYRFQKLFEHKHITEGEFRTFIHHLNEFNNSISTFKSMIRSATDRRKMSDPLYPEDFDGPLDVTTATDKWDAAIKHIEDQIRAWNKMNRNAEPITWGFTGCERLMHPPSGSP